MMQYQSLNLPIIDLCPPLQRSILLTIYNQHNTPFTTDQDLALSAFAKALANLSMGPRLFAHFTKIIVEILPGNARTNSNLSLFDAAHAMIPLVKECQKDGSIYKVLKGHSSLTQGLRGLFEPLTPTYTDVITPFANAAAQALCRPYGSTNTVALPFAQAAVSPAPESPMTAKALAALDKHRKDSAMANKHGDKPLPFAHFPEVSSFSK